MKSQTKWIILLIFSCLIFLLSACEFELPTPTPICVPTYDVTKPDDTDDGVCSPGDCSLREAVANANACPGNQTINLPADGYILTISGDDENGNKTGDLDVTDDLVIVGTGAPSINGNIERAFQVHNGVTATFEGIWLTDGDAIYGGGLVNEGFLTLNNFTCNYNNVSIPPGGMGEAMGGCIFNTSDLTINNGHFLGNTAGYGGAIYNLDNATALIENSSFYGNEAEFNGGALWNGVDAEFTINNSTLELNESGIDGGGVWNHGDFYGDGVVLEDNHAIDRGGAIYVWMDTFTQFNNSWLTGNSAHWGGGLNNNNGMVHFYESGITNNTATGPVGGGIYNNGPVPTGGLLLKNVTVSNNTALGGVGGGGIYNTGNFDFRFITISGNDPEGLRIDTGAEIKIRSSILADNPGGNCSGIAPDSLDYNLSGDTSCILTGPHDLTDTDPLLEPLGFHGSTAPSHPLGLGSPGIDSGVPDLCIANDQNYISRPQGILCDRGAFEVASPSSSGSSISGWTYIDANRNDVFDPTDGYMTGVMVNIHAGACPPAGPILETVESDSSGFYLFPDLTASDYCLQTSPLQQTLYPDDIGVSLGSGDDLTEVNFRYLLSPMGDSSISGLVWHDICAVPYATPSSPPPGCIWLPGGGLGADGVYDPTEPGIEGVKIKVFSGACPALPVAPAAEVYTNGDGEFSVPILGSGIWCAVVDALETPNDTILIPGNWTYPVRDGDPAEYEVVVGAGEDAVDVNFGWDYQSLPIADEPASNFCILTKNAFLRTGPSSSDYPTITAFLEGHPFEVLAASGPDRPGWFYGQDEAGFDGWIAQYLMECKGLDLKSLEVKNSPPVPIKTPTPLVCTPELPPDACKEAGGEMSSSVTRAPTCICP